MYRLLDIFFVIFHTSVILFNLFGWIWKRTRVANLILLLLTGSSWLVLGLIVGSPGYCPLTDWHFRILEKMGHTGLPVSYVKYLADRITGLDFNPSLVDTVTLIALLLALGLSVLLNTRDRFRSFKAKNPGKVQ
ncbi:MAG TPA: DUF2784 domain-containing protein [Bacteroidales bacterium]|nr:DUF2784 domain-containing protein [Bacteroidales bacterium]